MAGFIYVMTNPAFPDLVKIGKSSKDPSKYRAAQLQSTGVPAPFKVEYYALVDDENTLEKILHSHFAASRYSGNREFFEITTDDAVSTIKEVTNEQNRILHDVSNHISLNKIEPDNQKSKHDDNPEPEKLDVLDHRILIARQTSSKQNSMQLAENGPTLRKETASAALVASVLISTIALIPISAFLIYNFFGLDTKGIAKSIFFSVLLSIGVVFPLSLFACWPKK